MLRMLSNSGGVRRLQCIRPNNVLNMPSTKPAALRSAFASFSSNAFPAEKLRNLAVIAHIDHGKTTLVNQLLKEGGVKMEDSTDRLMDNLELESERGITIMSKATRVDWNDHVLNVVDTPGHQDFGGEVERVLSMVDGALLLVDASDGVMPQTKFVVQQALKQNLRFLVCINKVDRAIELVSIQSIKVMNVCGTNAKHPLTGRTAVLRQRGRK